MTHELGPLPSCDRDAGWHRIYTAEQLRAYALAEVEKAVQSLFDRMDSPTEEMELEGMRGLRSKPHTVSGQCSREQARACWDAMVSAMKAGK